MSGRRGVIGRLRGRSALLTERRPVAVGAVGSGAVVTHSGFVVREMRPPDFDILIDYFHDSSDEHLVMMGVDRALLPAREAWRSMYEEDFARPIELRARYAVVWELEGRVVGFSSTDRIEFGVQAHMHLHLLRADGRHAGLGSEFVKMSARTYFSVLELERLFCEPNAFNVAPNRAVQNAGFRYLFTHETQPGPINFPQATTRWVLERPASSTPRGDSDGG
jgi:RimJ/RimL family protein N-acetyltransferase